MEDTLKVVLVASGVIVGGVIAESVTSEPIFNFVEKDVRKSTLEMKAGEIREDIYLVSRFPEGHIEKSLGDEYSFSFDSRTMKITYSDAKAKKQLPVGLDEKEFTTKKICIEKTGSGVQVNGKAC